MCIPSWLFPIGLYGEHCQIFQILTNIRNIKKTISCFFMACLRKRRPTATSKHGLGLPIFTTY